MKPKVKTALPLIRREKLKLYSPYDYDPFTPDAWVRVVKGPFTDWHGTVIQQVTTFHSPFGMVIHRGIVIRLTDGTEVGPYMPDELTIVKKEGSAS